MSRVSNVRQRIEALAAQIARMPISVAEFDRRMNYVWFREAERGVRAEVRCDANSSARSMSNEELRASLYPYLLERERALGIKPRDVRDLTREEMDRALGLTAKPDNADTKRANQQRR